MMEKHRLRESPFRINLTSQDLASLLSEDERLRTDKAYAEAELARYKGLLEEAVRKKQFLTKEIDSLDGFLDWSGKESILQRNDVSRVHKLEEAFKANSVWGVPDDDAKRLDRLEYQPAAFDGLQTFVVTNDWATALGEAVSDVGSDFRLPFSRCAFELRITGKTVIVMAAQEDGSDSPPLATPFLDSGSGMWLSLAGPKGADVMGSFAWKQVRAICVALDAGVATRDVIRAPQALNAKRERAGKPPLLDYHVVNLARRHRINPGASSGSGRHPRLHFRRGHWRHFENHKTWINWMLVGNPDLGFIAKHYSL